MITQKARWMVTLLALMLLGVMALAACAPRAEVGALQSESQSVELGDDASVRVDIEFGAGTLEVSGGEEKLLEADFNYNVARLKPEVEYRNGTLSVTQPESGGLPALRGIDDFRNEWNLRLYKDVPLDLRVNVGAGTTILQLAGLSLTGLDVSLGAGESTIDLSGNWTRDVDVTVDAGAGSIQMRLPSNVGVRVEVDTGLGSVDAFNLKKDGNVYTNDAYATSDVTLDVMLKAGLGEIDLEVVEEAAILLDSPWGIGRGVFLKK